jgi:hypothetical protein
MTHQGFAERISNEEWAQLCFGIYNIKEVKDCVADAEWQRVRVSMLSTSLQFKYFTLKEYLDRMQYSHEAKVRVTNYVYALKRGGLIK